MINAEKSQTLLFHGFQPTPIGLRQLTPPTTIGLAVDLSDESLRLKWSVHHYLRPDDAIILLHVRPTSILHGIVAFDPLVAKSSDGGLGFEGLRLRDCIGGAGAGGGRLSPLHTAGNGPCRVAADVADPTHSGDSGLHLDLP
ncbi:hypothetical protein Vadar_021706 [Vaccinium darrowii]|uniref:Uncharacterized protein n=1 Tax=Vaccinium darrowii TaxID=229202 RepID=A0ACB7YXC0_9ERIC|nr:hypothetical protein Vadar_021706 [Vaccinium darrowii]